MKRFHVHVAVNDLHRSIDFHSTLFDSAPTVQQPDYAKWMLDDPRVNFAISQRAGELGVNHLGLQVESGEELVAMRDQLQRADAALLEERAARCCYATSDKYWITDPQGVAWETFRSLSSIPVYGEDRQTADTCCVPEASAKSEVACCSGGC